MKHSCSKSLSDEKGSKDDYHGLDGFVVNKYKQNNQTTVLITQEGDFSVEPKQQNYNYAKAAPPTAIHNTNNTATFKAGNGKQHHFENENVPAAVQMGTSVIAVKSAEHNKEKRSNSSSNSLVVIDGVESPIPKIINDP